LRHSTFQRLWLGLSISYLGDQFTIIGLLWFVLQLTGSGAAVGLVILCFDLPGVVTGAILGRLLDRYQPRLVIGYDNLAPAALIRRFPRSGQQPRLGYGRLCRTWWTTPPSIAPMR
jgi:MFS family permease